MAGKTYSLEFRDSLGAPTWETLANISAAATNRATEVLDYAPLGGSDRFYRIVTPGR